MPSAVSHTSGGSTGKLYAQIVNGAPYDVFLAADLERPRQLEADSLALKNSFFVYAKGFLVLWSSDATFSGKDCLQAFERGRFRKLAIANPTTAPYGAAAKRYLERNAHWVDVADRVVYGESVSQAFQFVVQLFWKRISFLNV